MSRREVSLPNGGPFVSPGVDPAKIRGVADYAAGIQQRRGAGGLPKQEQPLQTPRPPIPSLTSGPSSGQAGGQTMADAARAERASLGSPMMGGGIIQEAAPAAPAAVVRPTAASLGLAPADLLPPAAKEDPGYIQGHGAEFAVNQPSLAAKYGVLRNGQHVPPQRLARASTPGALRPETLNDLAKLQKLSAQPPAAESDPEDASARRAVEEGMGGAAARVGNEPGDRSVTAPTDEERETALRNAISQMDSFEFSQWRQLTMRQILHSEEERKLIESRLQPLDIGDLITKGVIYQRIPIIPGKYEVTFGSYDGQVDLALKRLVMQESKSVEVGDQYHLDKYGFMVLAVGLHKVNDKTFGDVLDKDGNFDDAMFLRKFNQVMRLPIHMLASIGVNQMWFEMRVRKLYSATAVGNG